MIAQVVNAKTSLTSLSDLGQVEFGSLLAQMAVIRDRINRLGGPNMTLLNQVIGRTGLNFEDFEGKIKIGTLNANVKRDFRVNEMISAMNTILDGIERMGAFGGTAALVVEVTKAASREEVMAEIKTARSLLSQKRLNEAAAQAIFAYKLAVNNKYADLAAEADQVVNQVKTLQAQEVKGIPILPVILGGVALVGLILLLLPKRKSGLSASHKSWNDGIGQIKTAAVRRGLCPPHKPIAVYEILGTRLDSPVCRALPGVRRVGIPRRIRRIRPEMLGL